MAERLLPLSGAPTGNGLIQMLAASPGTTIHTATAHTDERSQDTLWLWATNVSGTAVVLTLEMGGTGVANEADITIPANDMVPIMQGHPVNNGLVVAGYAGTPSVVNILGFVKRTLQQEE